MTPKLIFACVGIAAAVCAFVFTPPIVFVAAGVISVGIAVILS